MSERFVHDPRVFLADLGETPTTDSLGSRVLVAMPEGPIGDEASPRMPEGPIGHQGVTWMPEGPIGDEVSPRMPEGPIGHQGVTWMPEGPIGDEPSVGLVGVGVGCGGPETGDLAGFF